MQTTTATPATTVTKLELEITGKCQAQCKHCLAESGPTGTDGTMTALDWHRIINEAAELGVHLVQFIGGEPTLHGTLPEFVEHAVDLGLAVEVYSNLIHVRQAVWNVLTLPGVSLGTSYYSDQADEHERITLKRGSYRRTRANIHTATTRGIPVRAGIVRVLDEQRVDQAADELRALGVERITIDHARAVGRAATTNTTPDPSELCGNCTRGRAAILPNGDVAGCVLSRFMTAGNVLEQPLADILTGPQWAHIAEQVPAPSMACPPDDSGDCNPANTPACLPSYPKSAPTPTPTLGAPA